MLEQEFKYYLENQAELVKKYNEKYLIIKDNTVVESYNTKDEAYFNAKEKYEMGTYLLQYCAPGNMAYNQTFYSLNVAF